MTPSNGSASTVVRPVVRAEPSIRQVVSALFVTAWALNVLQHVRSFSRTTLRGDENVYMLLSRTMGWDLSNFTTMHDPWISQWPAPIYTQPVFYHGPVLPYLLKIGDLLGAPVQLGLLFQNVVIGMFFLHLRRLLSRLEVPCGWQLVGYFGLAVAPLILFSTTRLHQDAMAGMLIACGLIAFVEAMERQSSPWAVWSGLLFSLALNARFTAILVLPVLLWFHGYALARDRTVVGAGAAGAALRRRRWVLFLVTAGIVATIGLQHFYRLVFTYGVTGIGALLEPAAATHDPIHDQWIQHLATRTRVRMVANLVLTVPILLVFACPETYRTLRDGVRRRSWGAPFAAAFLFLLSAVTLQSYQELRFFAFATPLLYCCVPWIMAQARERYLRFYLPLAVVSLFSMLTAAYRESIVRPDEVYRIVPALYEYLPFMMSLW
jgi:hypothetical protein